MFVLIKNINETLAIKLCFCSQEKENPEYAKELKKADVEYEKKRDRLQTHYGNNLEQSQYFS